MKEIVKIIFRRKLKILYKSMDKNGIIKLLNKTKPFSAQKFYFLSKIIIIKGYCIKQIFVYYEFYLNYIKFKNRIKMK